MLLDPLFVDDEQADTIERLGAEFGTYRLYAEHEQIELEIGPGFLPRHDAVRNFLRTRVGSDDLMSRVAMRTPERKAKTTEPLKLLRRRLQARANEVLSNWAGEC